MNVDVDFTTTDAVPQTVLQASATFVARSRAGGSASIPPVVPVSEAEKALFEQGRRVMAARKLERDHSLDRVPPSGAELDRVHRIFLQGRMAAAAAAATAAAKERRGSWSASKGGSGSHSTSSAVEAVVEEDLRVKVASMEGSLVSTWEITQPQG